ncbi:hypothetical protein B0H12DRAFT_1233244 [Mycena haematopus]|nr:hypothetical protein B0H12DRAFT_1233244 [Mycena haematopus]
MGTQLAPTQYLYYWSTSHPHPATIPYPPHDTQISPGAQYSPQYMGSSHTSRTNTRPQQLAYAPMPATEPTPSMPTFGDPSMPAPDSEKIYHWLEGDVSSAIRQQPGYR